jgi:hypothetical protein
LAKARSSFIHYPLAEANGNELVSDDDLLRIGEFLAKAGISF